jgi:hypothetical protein
LSPPTANTTVVEILAAKSAPDWDNAEEAGAAKFKGQISGVYTERRERTTGEGSGTSSAENFGVRRSLTLSPRSLGEIEINQRDQIVYIWRNQKRTGSVVSVEEYDVPGRNMPGSIRITIDPVG